MSISEHFSGSKPEEPRSPMDKAHEYARLFHANSFDSSTKGFGHIRLSDHSSYQMDMIVSGVMTTHGDKNSYELTVSGQSSETLQPFVKYFLEDGNVVYVNSLKTTARRTLAELKGENPGSEDFIKTVNEDIKRSDLGMHNGDLTALLDVVDSKSTNPWKAFPLIPRQPKRNSSEQEDTGSRMKNIVREIARDEGKVSYIKKDEIIYGVRTLQIGDKPDAVEFIKIEPEGFFREKTIKDLELWRFYPGMDIVQYHRKQFMDKASIPEKEMLHTVEEYLNIMSYTMVKNQNLGHESAAQPVDMKRGLELLFEASVNI